MVKSCYFGVLIFGRQFNLIYRFLSDDLFNYLYQRHLERLESFEQTNPAADEMPFSINDTIALTFSTLLHFYDQTHAGDSPIKRITLERNIQVFFDSMADNRILCVADESFDTLVILKTINLFKSLVRFHLGAFPFTQCPTVKKAIDRISAGLQYYLNNVMTNQSLIFESSEYLLFNALIRGQCNDACSIINVILQQAPTLILITCRDKIAHMQISNEQNRPSNSDIFLLLLNNISRTLRDSFQTDDLSSSTIEHSYRRKSDQTLSSTLTNLSSTFSQERHLSPARRTMSLPTTTDLESLRIDAQRTVDVIFMKTSNKNLAPFTVYTLPLTEDISVLILVESKHSIACSSLSELIHQLNLCIKQSQLSYKNLSSQIRSLEKHTIFKPYLDDRPHSSNILLKLLDTTHAIYKSLPKAAELIDKEDQRIYQIQDNLAAISEKTVDIFHCCFFSTKTSNENNIIEPTIIQNLQRRLLGKLGDWFPFIETKAQANITISFCQQRFPGLVHFALIDRSRGRICTPALFTEEYKNYLALHYDHYDNELVKENKVIEFELECLSALQRGCTSYTLTDDCFTYNYTLRLEESNGASMRLYKPFVKFEPPGILHYDFYEKLVYENYASLGDQTSISCFELICVHLRFVPPDIVREHCQQLWSTLRELDD